MKTRHIWQHQFVLSTFPISYALSVASLNQIVLKQLNSILPSFAFLFSHRVSSGPARTPHEHPLQKPSQRLFCPSFFPNIFVTAELNVYPLNNHASECLPHSVYKFVFPSPNPPSPGLLGALLSSFCDLLLSLSLRSSLSLSFVANPEAASYEVDVLLMLVALRVE